MIIREQVAIDMTTANTEKTDEVELVIYVAPHCSVCAYAYEVAEDIRQRFPDVNLKLVDMESTTEPIPETVFATPTYVLNGRVWSLGNPSPDMVVDTFSKRTQP